MALGATTLAAAMLISAGALAQDERQETRSVSFVDANGQPTARRRSRQRLRAASR